MNQDDQEISDEDAKATSWFFPLSVLFLFVVLIARLNVLHDYDRCMFQGAIQVFNSGKNLEFKVFSLDNTLGNMGSYKVLTLRFCI